MVKERFARLILLLALLCLLPSVQAEPRFPHELAVDQHKLSRCSQAELKAYRLIHVGYAALYLPDCKQLQEILKPIPKRMRFLYERAIPAHAFRESSEQYLKLNLAAKYSDWQAVFAKFNSAYRDVDKGDTYELIYSPDRGLQLLLNSSLLATLDNPEQALAYFSIWFGEEPFSETLKTDLLSPETG